MSSSKTIFPKIEWGRRWFPSLDTCRTHYGVTPDCTVVWNDNATKIIAVGDNHLGQFEGEADIAGVGVIYAFIFITGVSLSATFIRNLEMGFLLFKQLVIKAYKYTLACRLFGGKCLKHRKDRHLRDEETRFKNWCLHAGWFPALNTKLNLKESQDPSNDITLPLEPVIFSCSAQQILLGLAYLFVTIGPQSCTISAYHYNLINDLLSVSTATHLLALLLTRQYLKENALAFVRLLVSTFIITVQMIFLPRRGAIFGVMKFPTDITRHPDYAVMFRDKNFMMVPQICLLEGSNLDRFGPGFDANLKQYIQYINVTNPSLLDTPSWWDNSVDGWEIAQTVAYFIAAIVTVVLLAWRLLARWEWFSEKVLNVDPHTSSRRRRTASELFREAKAYDLPLAWMFGKFWPTQYFPDICILISAVVLWLDIRAIDRKRDWVQGSGWLSKDDNGRSDEDNFMTFGQVPPIIFTVFTGIEVLVALKECWKRWRRHKRGSESSDEDNAEEQLPFASPNPTHSECREYPEGYHPIGHMKSLSFTTTESIPLQIRHDRRNRP